MKITKIKNPRMVESSLKRRGIDEEPTMETTPPSGYGKQPPKAMDEVGAKRQGPDVPALHEKMMAKGGKVTEPRTEASGSAAYPTSRPDNGFGKVIVKECAEGGMIDESEMSEEEHASVAAAIMARKRAEKALHSDSDEDEMVMMAEGGQVDIAANGREEPNHMDKRNAAVLKENYDADLMDVSQPIDSNEKGDEREKAHSDRHSMISEIRSKIRSKIK